MASDLITSWQREGGKVETVTDFISLVSKITVDGECSHKIKGCLFLGRKAVTNLGKGKESEVAQPCPTFATPWTVAYQTPPSMGFSRQECWNRLPFPSPGDLPDNLHI